MKEIRVYSVMYSLLSNHRVILLKEIHGERFLPIWIGHHEWEAIRLRLQGIRMQRPLTHDLLKNVIVELGGELQYVVVNALRNNTFYAKMAVEQDGQMRLIDSRPSDAIALALRASVPIYVEEEVLEEAGILPSPEIRSHKEQEDDLDVFRDFLDTLDLDDTGD